MVTLSKLPKQGFSIMLVEGEPVRALAPMLTQLCQDIFGSFDADYLIERMAGREGLALHLAHNAQRKALGFKLGYQREPGLFYSWLGGVAPRARGEGIAPALTAAQHAWAREAGYRTIETRSRNNNNAMIVVNLRAGFRITGYEADERGFGMVVQQISLASPRQEDNGASDAEA